MKWIRNGLVWDNTLQLKHMADGVSVLLFDWREYFSLLVLVVNSFHRLYSFFLFFYSGPEAVKSWNITKEIALIFNYPNACTNIPRLRINSLVLNSSRKLLFFQQNSFQRGMKQWRSSSQEGWMKERKLTKVYSKWEWMNESDTDASSLPKGSSSRDLLALISTQLEINLDENKKKTCTKRWE